MTDLTFNIHINNLINKYETLKDDNHELEEKYETLKDELNDIILNLYELQTNSEINILKSFI